MAIHFAKAAAANAVIDGWKTVEMCQAFALWSVYNPPARRWEEDRAWCYTGIAFRFVHSPFPGLPTAARACSVLTSAVVLVGVAGGAACYSCGACETQARDGAQPEPHSG